MRKIRIIISPAKTMKVDNDGLRPRQMPVFLEEAKTLADYLKTLDYDELKSIWKSSDNIAKKNFYIVKDMDLCKNLTPAIVSFKGLQYQHMGPGVFTYEQLDYIEEHLRILSGFYGILRPFDGVVPYRLEMQSRFSNWKYDKLYDFWDDKIARSISSESDCIINLASKEYSDSISKYLSQDTRFITCVFGELIDGEVIQKATLVKMARGEMVRFMAENNIKKVEDIKKFNSLSYFYKDELSDDGNYVFIKE